MIKLKLVQLLAFSTILLSANAYAGCTSPSADTGAIIYNLDHNVFQGCDQDGLWVLLRGKGIKCDSGASGLNDNLGNHTATTTLRPNTDKAYDLGTSSAPFSNSFFAGQLNTGNLTASGKTVINARLGIGVTSVNTFFNLDLSAASTTRMSILYIDDHGAGFTNKIRTLLSNNDFTLQFADTNNNFLKNMLHINVSNANLTIYGTARKAGGGSWSASSDKRLKDIQHDYTQGLDAITKLKPVIFSYKENNPRSEPSDKKYAGLIAQDVQKIFPEAVMLEEDGYYSLDSSPLKYALINAIKELKAANDKQAEEIKLLTKALEDLEE